MVFIVGFSASLVPGVALALGVGTALVTSVALALGATLALGTALALGVGTVLGSTLALDVGTVLGSTLALDVGTALGSTLALDVGTALGAALALGVGTALAPGAALTLGAGVSPPRLRYVLISHAPVAPRSALVKPFTLLHSGESIEALSFFLLRLQQQILKPMESSQAEYRLQSHPQDTYRLKV